MLVDHLAGADSIYSIALGPCPACAAEHRVTLSRIGWFAFRCGRIELRGQVADWLPTRRAWERTGAGDAAPVARRAP